MPRVTMEKVVFPFYKYTTNDSGFVYTCGNNRGRKQRCTTQEHGIFLDPLLDTTILINLLFSFATTYAISVCVCVSGRCSTAQTK